MFGVQSAAAARHIPASSAQPIAETVVTEELIRVKTRDRRIAEFTLAADEGGGGASSLAP